jgi:hypothetical protein
MGGRIENVLISGPDRQMILMADEIFASGSLIYDFDERPEGVGTLSAFSESLVDTGIPDLDLSVGVYGLSLPVELTERDRLSIPGAADLQLPDGYRISGDLIVEAVARGNRMRVVFDHDMDGLFMAEGEITVAPNGQARQLMTMMSGSRSRGFLASLGLIGFELSIADRGIDDVVRLNSGGGVVDLVSMKKDALLDRVPGRLQGAVAPAFEAVIDWIGKGVSGGADVSARPDRPVTAVEFGTMFALNPELALGLLNISSE